MSITCCCAFVNIEHFQGCEVNTAHETDSMQSLSWVEWMRDRERTRLWLPKNTQACRFRVANTLLCPIVHSTNQMLLLLEQLTPWTQDGVKLLHSPYFFPLLHPHTVNPNAPTHRYLVPSPVLLASRDQDAGPSNSTIEICRKNGANNSPTPASFGAT